MFPNLVQLHCSSFRPDGLRLACDADYGQDGCVLPAAPSLIWYRATRLLRRTVPVFLVFIKCLVLVAAPPQGPDYFTHVWQVEDGLPQNAVTTIVQTHDGYIWLGTYNGLARFDGVRFKVFNNGNTPELHSSRVTSLFEDPEGKLWIGHETGELTWLKDGRFHTMEIPSNWKSGKIFGISSDVAGDIWLANENCQLIRLRDNLMLSPRAGNAPKLMSFVKDTQGLIWVVRDGMASVLKPGGKLEPVNFDKQSVDSFIQGICASRDGGLWVASDGRIRKWHEGNWTTDLGTTPWGTDSVSSMIETRNGSLAGGTVDSGLYLIVPNSKTLHLSTTNGLPQNWVRALYEDLEGNVWIGAGSGGLVALRAGKVATISPQDRWQGRAILSVTATQDGAMWIGTEGAGLYQFRNDLWSHYGANEGLANQFVWSVAENEQGELWAGTWGGGLFTWRSNRFERVRGLESIMIPTTGILHAKGISWIGTGDGLLRYESGVTQWFGRKEGLQLPDVRTVIEGQDGTIWFGMSGGGLGCLKNGKLKQFLKKDGLSSDFVQCLRLEGEDTLWIGTFGGGLNRLKQGRFSTINSEQGLPNSVICQIEEDENGYFWIGSHGGILCTRKWDLNRCADGQTNWIHCIAYGKGEGLPTLECSGGMQPAGCKTVDGRLWFPTSKGLVTINPNLVKNNHRPPPVLIEDVLVEGQPIPLGKAGDPPLQIHPGRNQFEFRFTGLSFTVPEKVRFKYRVDNLETDWRDADTKRTAQYSYIPPGNYTFKVIACNNDGIWNETGADLAFTVLPHFWQTWWFRLIAGLGGTTLVAGTVLFETRRRMRYKLERLERQRAVERERARIAKDIHDDLGASLTRITLLSQSARTELDQPRTVSDLDLIYDTARELTRAMDEIVWAVNPQHDTLDSLATYLGKFAQDFLASAHVRCRLDVPMQLPCWPVSAEVRHNLFLAFKEAIHNAVKHAGASEVRVSLVIQPTGFALRVEDLGRGFSTENLQADLPQGSGRISCGNGLINMRQRLSEIGGCCEIRSVPGEGTVVTFFVHVKVPTNGEAHPPRILNRLS